MTHWVTQQPALSGPSVSTLAVDYFDLGRMLFLRLLLWPLLVARHLTLLIISHQVFRNLSCGINFSQLLIQTPLLTSKIIRESLFWNQVWETMGSGHPKYHIFRMVIVVWKVFFFLKKIVIEQKKFKVKHFKTALGEGVGKWLLSKYDHTSSIVRPVWKRPGMLAYAWNPSTGQQDRLIPETHWLASLSSWWDSGQWGTWFSETSRVVPREWQFTLSSGLYLHAHTCAPA